MKNPFSTNFAPEQPKYGVGQLPAGAYVAGIIGAKAEQDKLTIQVEIIEGEYTGYYKKQYDGQNSQYRAPKYKGVYVLRFPDGESQNVDDIREREARGAAWAVEKSNAGYKWQWETLERDLKGKQVGISVRERDWCMEDTTNGGYRTGTTTEIGQLEDVNAVRDGKVKLMRKRELSKRDKERLDAYKENHDADDSGFTAV